MSEPDWAAAARSAGWLPPDEVKIKVWRAHNLNRDSCRWCGAIRAEGTQGRNWQKRDGKPAPHKPSCRFYDGPVKHGFHSGHDGTFDYWINCTCGKSYPEHDIAGNKQECPDREMTWRHPSEPDLTAEPLRAGTAGQTEPPCQ